MNVDAEIAKVRAHYPAARRWSLGLATILLFAFIIVSFILAQFADPSMAQTPSSIESESQSTYFSGAIEELSRSQDRLVNALIGAVGVLGAFLVAVVGVSTYQSNRNAERENELIRNLAMSEINKATDKVAKEAEQIITYAKSEVIRYAQTKSHDFEKSLTESGENSLAQLERESKNAVRQISDALPKFRSDVSELIEGASSYFFWMVGKQVETDISGWDVQRLREHGSALLSLAVAGEGIRKLASDRFPDQFVTTISGSLIRGLELFNTGYDLPEENEAWTTNNGHLFKTITKLVYDLDQYHHRLNNKTTFDKGKYRELMPLTGDKIDPRELKRMVQQKRANR